MSNKLKIFLSGGMTGLTEAEASYWRTSFKLNNAVQDDTPFIFIDPTYYYFTTDKTTQEYEKEAMRYDLYWVKHSWYCSGNNVGIYIKQTNYRND